MPEEIKIVVNQESKGSAFADAIQEARHLRDEIRQTEDALKQLRSERESIRQNGGSTRAEDEMISGGQKKLDQLLDKPVPGQTTSVRQDRAELAARDAKWAQEAKERADKKAADAATDAAKAAAIEDLKTSPETRVDRKRQEREIDELQRMSLAERAGGNTGQADALEREVEIRRAALQIQRTQNNTEAEATILAANQVAAQEKITAAKKAEADAAKAAAAAAKAAPGEDFKRQEGQIKEMRDKALAARAGGRGAEADHWDRQANIGAESLLIQKKLNIPEWQAKPMAAKNIDAKDDLAAKAKAEAEAKKTAAEAEAAAKKAAVKAAQDEAAATRQRKKDEDEILRIKKQQQAEADKKEKAEKKAAEQEEKSEAVAAKRRVAEGKLVAGNVIREGASQAGVPLGPLGGALGNPMAIVGSLIAGYIGKALAQQLAIHDSVAAEAGRGVGSANASRLIGHKFGSERQDESSQQLEENKRGIEEAIKERGTARVKGVMDRIKLFANSVGGFQFETSADETEREIQQRLNRLLQERPGKQKAAQKAFNEGPGADEAEAVNREARDDLAGARASREQAVYLRRVAQLETQLGQDAEGSAKAREIAGMELYNKERNIRLDAARALVNARSGAGDIAAAARSVGSPKEISEAFKKALDPLHETMRVHHREALNARPHQRF